MNKLFFVVLILFARVLISQNESVFYNNSLCSSVFYSMESCNTSNPNSLKDFLEKQLNCELQVAHESKNNYCKTISFQQYKNSLEVYHGFVKVIIDHNSKSFMANYTVFTNLPNELASNPTGKCWYNHQGQWIIASKEILSIPEQSTLDEIIKDKNNNIISKTDLALRALPKDTLIRVKVFNPDPLTTAKQTYTAPYLDYNDSDVAVINAQRVWKNVVCKFDKDTFWLKNQYLVPFKYKINSYGPVYRVKDTVFDYTRHQHEFEDVMVMYHVTTFQNYINSIGFDTIGFRPTPYDAHGETSDNSAYYPGTGLVFGIGGIDDAEDAEVITHEYSHGLREYASPNTNHGLERMSLEEGMMDYLSTSYKMTIDSFGWKKWAIWDGNNQQTGWLGRNVASAKIYPQALTGDIWLNGEIWSSALMRIYFKLGKTKTDRMAMQTLYYLSDGLSMSQTALLFIKADSAIYGGAHTEIIWRTFAETHILPWFSSIHPMVKNLTENVKLINSLNFASNKGNLLVYLPKTENVTYSVYNGVGQQIKKESIIGDNFQLVSGSIQGSGIYYLTVSTPTYTETKRLVVE